MMSMPPELVKLGEVGWAKKGAWLLLGRVALILVAKHGSSSACMQACSAAEVLVEELCSSWNVTPCAFRCQSPPELELERGSSSAACSQQTTTRPRFPLTSNGTASADVWLFPTHSRNVNPKCACTTLRRFGPRTPRDTDKHRPRPDTNVGGLMPPFGHKRVQSPLALGAWPGAWSARYSGVRLGAARLPTLGWGGMLVGDKH